LDKMSGSSTEAPAPAGGSAEAYPSLRQLPRLAVPYANLYRRVRIQETVYELLSQQFEVARIEEAKDTPIVSVIDAPLVPEKKSFPPRLLVMLILTSVVLIVTAAFILVQNWWLQLAADDSRKALSHRMAGTLFSRGGER
jgi:uncharacterized protein involved in exopolysaccharide biosynthesis